MAVLSTGEMAIPLEKVRREMLAYIEQSHLRVFHGELVSGSSTIAYRWDEANGDWKAFVDIAKSSAAVCVAVKVSTGAGQHTDEVASIDLSWAKDGAVYSYGMKAPWWNGDELKREWEARTDDELADEIIRFGQKEYFEAEKPPIEQVAVDYWASLGIASGPGSDPALNQMVARVSKMAVQKSLQMEIEQARRLVGELASWSRAREMRRVDDSAINEFLSLKRMTMSDEAKEELKSSVNFELSDPR